MNRLLAISTILLSQCLASLAAEPSSQKPASPDSASPDSISIEEQIRRRLPAATAIDASTFRKIASGTESPTKESFNDHSLTAELMVLGFNPKHAASQDFRFLTDGQPEPTALAQEIYRGVGSGPLKFTISPVTLVHYERITDCQAEVNGNRATGSFAFRVPKLYEGRADFVAKRHGKKWKLTELQMKGLGIHVRSDDSGRWWSVADLDGHALPQTLDGHYGPVWHIDFSPDGQRLASCSSDRDIRLWRVASDQPPLVVSGADWKAITWVDFSPDGQRIATASQDGFVKIRNAATGKWQRELPIKNLANQALFSPDGKQILVASGNITLWDAATGERQLAIEQHNFPVVDFSPDGRIIASGGAEGNRHSVRLWNAAAGKSMATSENAHQDLITAICFSPDGKRFATSSRDKTVKLWQAPTALEPYVQLLKTIKTPEAPVHCLAYSPDGKWLASGDARGRLILWDAATGKQHASYPKHFRAIRSVAFSPDGELLATGSTDGVVRLWAIKSQQ